VLEGVVPPPPRAGGERRAMATGAVDVPLLDAFDRLLALLDQPQHAPVLAPLVRREITYRLLTGEAGWRLRQIAAVDSQGHQVARAIALLRARYVQPLRVEDLAREALMSVSSFHHHFKSLTGMSPLQFQKQLRLGEARRLMLTEHLDAASAAYRVGYESASQFSREYARQFGAPPVRDISALRLPPHAPGLATAQMTR
jgi:transcriptional regulator GlxA family with amidase domain